MPYHGAVGKEYTFRLHLCIRGIILINSWYVKRCKGFELLYVARNFGIFQPRQGVNTASIVLPVIWLMARALFELVTIFSQLFRFLLFFLQLVTHTAVHNEMNRKWHGREFMKSKWKSWQLTFFNIWCLFDLVLSPILLAVFSLMRNKVKGTNKVEQYIIDGQGRCALTLVGEWILGTLLQS